MKNNLIWTALFLVIVFILFLYIFPHLNIENNGCSLHMEVYNQEIQSKVERKFIDTPNHALKKIIYLDDNKEEKELVFYAEYKNMYDSLNIGDSIIKKSGTLYYKIKSKTKDRMFKFYTLCKDSIR